jgi:hypothetical protein
MRFVPCSLWSFCCPSPPIWRIAVSSSTYLEFLLSSSTSSSLSASPWWV